VSTPSAGRARGRSARELSDTELEQQGTQAHATRNWVFLHGTAEQFAQHTERMLELEQEYLRRHPQRTWQSSRAKPEADPERAVLAVLAQSGGRMHKLAVHQAARAAGLPRAALARLYSAGFLGTDGAERVLTEAGRAWLDSPGAPTPHELRWVSEPEPVWDEGKQRIIGGAPLGVFDLHHQPGESLAGDWWAVNDGHSSVLGYGWMDVTWGEAEVLLAVAPDAQHRGVGSWTLAQLEREAGQRGLNYVYNTVRPTHPDRERMHDWLAALGYRGSDSDAALRKRVGIAPEPPAPLLRVEPQSSGGDRGPGREDQGGYVDVEHHSY